VKKMANVNITYSIGEVYRIRSGRKKRVKAKPLGDTLSWVNLKDGDRIITGARSYVVELSDSPGPTQTGTSITAFPNSEFILGIKGIIRKVELMKGLFQITTEKEVVTPTAELRFRHGNGSFWIDVASDGSVVVASESNPIEVIHKKTKRGVVIKFKEQVVLTKEEILEPCGIDQRFKEAYKIREQLSIGQSKYMYEDMLNEEHLKELQERARMIEEATGEKQNFDIKKTTKYYKKQRAHGEKGIEYALQAELPDFKKTDSVANDDISKEPVFGTINMNKSINYQGVEFLITTVEKRNEFKNRKVPEGKIFLVLNIESKNNSDKQAFVFYDEEVRLTDESEQVIPLKNYSLKTSFEPGRKNIGFLLFLVDNKYDKFKLQLGKMSLPKIELELNLPKNIEGGD
jgi:hypothetical protein